MSGKASQLDDDNYTSKTMKYALNSHSITCFHCLHYLLPPVASFQSASRRMKPSFFFLESHQNVNKRTKGLEYLELLTMRLMLIFLLSATGGFTRPYLVNTSTTSTHVLIISHGMEVKFVLALFQTSYQFSVRPSNS